MISKSGIIRFILTRSGSIWSHSSSKRTNATSTQRQTRLANTDMCNMHLPPSERTPMMMMMSTMTWQHVQRSHLVKKCYCPIRFTQSQKIMISYSTTYILVKKAQEMFCLVIHGLFVLKVGCPSSSSYINLPSVVTWWIPSNFFVAYMLYQVHSNIYG